MLKFKKLDIASPFHQYSNSFKSTLAEQNSALEPFLLVYTLLISLGAILNFQWMTSFEERSYTWPKMATKEESSVDVDFVVCSYNKECFYFISRGIFSL